MAYKDMYKQLLQAVQIGTVVDCDSLTYWSVYCQGIIRGSGLCIA